MFKPNSGVARLRASNRASLFMTAVFSASMVNAACAADQPANEVSTVVVTAQKRQEDVSKVPVTVQALSGALLQRQRIENVQKIVDLVPNASLAGESSKGTEVYQVRGVAVGDTSGDATVAAYLDDFAYSIPGSPYAPPADLYDLQRVEVLKGPQGTLYGSNSLGGVIKIVTNDPNLAEFQTTGDASVGQVWNHDRNYRGDLMLNAPIVQDKLAVRAVLSGQHLSGYSYLPLLNRQNGNKADVVLGRVKVLFQPTDKLSVLAGFWRYEVAQDFTNRLDSANPPIDLATGGNSPTDYTLYTLRVNYDLGWADLTSASGYILRHYGILLTGCQIALCYDLDTKDRTTAFNQEIRLSSKNNGPLHWVAGLYYDNSIDQGPTNFKISPPLVPIPEQAPPVDSVAHFHMHAKEIAGFGEVSYDLFDGKLRPLVGLRYSYVDRLLNQNSIATLNGAVLVDTKAAVEGQYYHISPRFNLSYFPTENGMLYFNMAEGYRPGALQTASAVASLETILGVQTQEKLQTDSLWSYEVGAKWAFLDRSLSVSLSLYAIDWKRAQLQTGLSGTSGVLNVGDVNGKGVEIYITDRPPIPGLTLQFAGGWNSTKLQDIDPNILARLTFLHNGMQLPPVPKENFSVIANYEHPTNYYDATFIADARYQFRSRERDLSTGFESADLNIIDADVGFKRNGYTVQFFADNLTNDKGPSIWEQGRMIVPFPRTVGVRFIFSGI